MGPLRSCLFRVLQYIRNKTYEKNKLISCALRSLRLSQLKIQGSLNVPQYYE